MMWQQNAESKAVCEASHPLVLSQLSQPTKTIPVVAWAAEQLNLPYTAAGYSLDDIH